LEKFWIDQIGKRDKVILNRNLQLARDIRPGDAMLSFFGHLVFSYAVANSLEASLRLQEF